MQRIDLEQIAEALRLLQRAQRNRAAHAGNDPRECESTARSLLHAILDRHGHELDDFQPPDVLEERRERLVAEIESGFGELRP